MLAMSLPWWEFVLRAVVVYAFLQIALRLTGKRQVGQLSPFDLVLLLVLSNAVQNSMNGGDNSLVGGLISAMSLVGLNYGVGVLTWKSKKAESFIEGHPKILVHDGKVLEIVMNQEKMTRHELDAAIRKAGLASLSEVRFAILENDGTISVIGK